MILDELPAEMTALDDAGWLQLLLRSIDQREIDGVRFPGFPEGAVQRRYVGGENATTLHEAARFYSLVKSRALSLGMPLVPGRTMMDFGCGWGRFLRFFWRDVRASGLYGCDISTEALDLCRALGVPGNLDRVYPGGRLPYASGSMNAAMAYSVFTHLPEDPHMHWVAEIARVLAPGAVFALTLEPRRFLDFVAGIDAEDTNEWHAQLRPHAADIPRLKAEFDDGRIAFLPTGQAAEFSSANYGDCAVPLGFVERHWSEWFHIREYQDNPSQFFQAVLVVQRK